MAKSHEEIAAELRVLLARAAPLIQDLRNYGYFVGFFWAENDGKREMHVRISFDRPHVLIFL